MNNNKVIVICSKFNEEIVNNLYLGVEKSLHKRNVNFQRDLIKITVPGAFEIPYMAKKILKKGMI